MNTFAAKTVIFLFMGFLALPPPCHAWETYVGKSIEGRVEKVEDGNVLMVKSADGDLAVSFYGIGIPTARQPFGQQAHKTLVDLLPKGAQVILTTVNRNEEGVISALVQFKDHSVNNMLVDQGLAWVDRRTCKAFFCRRWHIQEHLAVKDRRGVWSLNLSSPPWQWSDEKGM